MQHPIWIHCQIFRLTFFSHETSSLACIPPLLNERLLIYHYHCLKQTALYCVKSHEAAKWSRRSQNSLYLSLKVPLSPCKGKWAASLSKPVWDTEHFVAAIYDVTTAQISLSVFLYSRISIIFSLSPRVLCSTCHSLWSNSNILHQCTSTSYALQPTWLYLTDTYGASYTFATYEKTTFGTPAKGLRPETSASSPRSTSVFRSFTYTNAGIVPSLATASHPIQSWAFNTQQHLVWVLCLHSKPAEVLRCPRCAHTLEAAPHCWKYAQVWHRRYLFQVLTSFYLYVYTITIIMPGIPRHYDKCVSDDARAWQSRLN